MLRKLSMKWVIFVNNLVCLLLLLVGDTGRNQISSLRNTVILKDELLSLKGLVKSLESISVLKLLKLQKEDVLIVVKNDIMLISVQTHLIN
jgi:hypothetical protein